MMKYTLGFLGAGNMAEAIAKAAMERGIVPAAHMIASDPSQARRDVFAAMGIAVTTSNEQVISQCSQVMLAVKPQMMANVYGDLAKHGSQDQIILSIVTGITIAKMNATVVAAGGKTMRVIRIMPNTPIMVSQGMAGIAAGVDCHPGDDELAMKLFSAGGKAIQVEESLIDAITVVSGSGPAYLFYLAQAMEEAATKLGLGEHARLLVAQTLKGASELLMQSPDTPAELRRKVTSPGGTTEAAIKHMEANRVMAVIVEAIEAAEKRSKELGK